VLDLPRTIEMIMEAGRIRRSIINKGLTINKRKRKIRIDDISPKTLYELDIIILI
jgi:hypothetical protein